MKRICCTVILFLCLFLSQSAYAVDANLHADWAWNGTDTTIQGFKFYLDGAVVTDVADGAARTTDMTVDLSNGVHQFSMTAYGPDWETAHSPDYKFEYIYVPDSDKPAPTVYIRIN